MAVFGLLDVQDKSWTPLAPYFWRENLIGFECRYGPQLVVIVGFFMTNLYKFNELYSLISTYELQNSRIIQPRYLDNAYRQSGLGEVSETLGIDTRRRIMSDLEWKHTHRAAFESSEALREEVYKIIQGFYDSVVQDTCEEL